MQRPSIETTMLVVAAALAQRATCIKLSVGCVMTDHYGRILSAGYNGMPMSLAHCNEGNNFCTGPCLATHAESNALLSCRDISSIHTCYVTHSPCLACVKQLIQTECRRIVYMTDTEEVEAASKLWNRVGRTWYQHPVDVEYKRRVSITDR